MYIFAGGLGSGKTEMALNVTSEKAEQRPVLADLDLVNPYCCSREMEEKLQEKGITFIGPPPELRLSDVPFMPAGIIGYLKSDRLIVLDVGGDEVGCNVLGYLSRYISVRDYSMYLVINPFRPYARTMDHVIGLRNSLEKASRLKFSAIVSNPNLNLETLVDSVLEGHEINLRFARELGLPIAYLAVEEGLASEVIDKVKEKVYPIKIHLRPDWT
ncbi:MAG: hypothetical protein ACM3MK_06190 [Chitinophagales bacterium]